jgi:uncharacterized membrane protein YhaH (DUF805 family)
VGAFAAISPKGTISRAGYWASLLPLSVAVPLIVATCNPLAALVLPSGLYLFTCLNAKRLRHLGQSQWWLTIPVTFWLASWAVPSWLLWILDKEGDHGGGPAVVVAFIYLAGMVVSLVVSAVFAISVGFQAGVKLPIR